MSQSKEYLEYRKRYDEISKKIRELYAEQHKIHELMQKHCNHSNLQLVEHDPLEIALGIVNEDEVQYKCLDCWRYFSLKEAKELNLI